MTILPGRPDANTGPEAFRFHKLAQSFLADLGFKLINDPSVIISPYQQTQATYHSPSGLYIYTGFEPADSNGACITFGRRWSAGKFGYVLSNNYSLFAAEQGVELPTSYTLGYGNEIDNTIRQVFSDVERTLPGMLRNIELSTLQTLEELPGGAVDWATRLFGQPYKDQVEISKFDQNLLCKD
ncbi:hypothetical protein [uncultured Microbulbifer sp.]|uniref:hypothetical protein n=1 Tax=uncultured Microbulbifer sp. TaxID=348147 RepID=UPI00262EA5D3|nr:hypothetical protein [uncultured Microbulbifer sp.]